MTQFQKIYKATIILLIQNFQQINLMLFERLNLGLLFYTMDIMSMGFMHEISTATVIGFSVGYGF